MLIKGKKVTLGPMDTEAWRQISLAHLDAGFDSQCSDDTFPKSGGDIEMIYSKFSYPQGRIFQIFAPDNKTEPAQHGIGYVGICSIDWKNRNCEIHIGICNREFRKQGFGIEAGSIMVEYCFKQLGLHRVYAVVIQGNDLLINTAKTIGFKEEGMLRACYFINDKYKNGILVSMINPVR